MYAEANIKFIFNVSFIFKAQNIYLDLIYDFIF